MICLVTERMHYCRLDLGHRGRHICGGCDMEFGDEWRNYNGMYPGLDGRELFVDAILAKAGAPRTLFGVLSFPYRVGENV